MAKITYIEHNGISHTFEVGPGRTVMEVAVQNGVSGIDADCGGACACATCHVYVDENWAAKLAPAEEMEKMMLEYAVEAQESSRLSCQIKITEEMDGLVVRLPGTQH